MYSLFRAISLLALPLVLLVACSDTRGDTNSATRKPADRKGDGEATVTTIAIRPLGGFDRALTRSIGDSIRRYYNVDIEYLPDRPIPREAWYAPRKRYRADSLLHVLDGTTDGRFTKVLGLVEKDISTTKGEYKDWGVLGLGSLGGRPCVISTYRMGRRRVAKTLFMKRFVSVVIHELGHTFGLPHCPVTGCVMEDAKGTVATVDREKGFCEECSKTLRGRN